MLLLCLLASLVHSDSQISIPIYEVTNNTWNYQSDVVSLTLDSFAQSQTYVVDVSSIPFSSESDLEFHLKDAPDGSWDVELRDDPNFDSTTTDVLVNLQWGDGKSSNVVECDPQSDMYYFRVTSTSTESTTGTFRVKIDLTSTECTWWDDLGEAIGKAFGTIFLLLIVACVIVVAIPVAILVLCCGVGVACCCCQQKKQTTSTATYQNGQPVAPHNGVAINVGSQQQMTQMQQQNVMGSPQYEPQPPCAPQPEYIPQYVTAPGVP